jgi:hypothetical protein
MLLAVAVDAFHNLTHVLGPEGIGGGPEVESLQEPSPRQLNLGREGIVDGHHTERHVSGRWASVL